MERTTCVYSETVILPFNWTRYRPYLIISLALHQESDISVINRMEFAREWQEHIFPGEQKIRWRLSEEGKYLLESSVVRKGTP